MPICGLRVSPLLPNVLTTYVVDETLHRISFTELVLRSRPGWRNPFDAEQLWHRACLHELAKKGDASPRGDNGGEGAVRVWSWLAPTFCGRQESGHSVTRLVIQLALCHQFLSLDLHTFAVKRCCTLLYVH